MNHQTLARIMTALAVIMLGITMILHSSQIKELRNEIACLQQDRFYVGSGFCADKEIENGLRKLK